MTGGISGGHLDWAVGGEDTAGLLRWRRQSWDSSRGAGPPTPGVQGAELRWLLYPREQTLGLTLIDRKSVV